MSARKLDNTLNYLPPDLREVETARSRHPSQKRSLGRQMLDGPPPCIRCKGAGIVPTQHRRSTWRVDTDRPVPLILVVRCTVCDGTGVVTSAPAR